MPEIKTTLILDLKVTMTVSVELQVEASRTGNIIKCSEKVIASCNLLLNMIDVTESKDNLPIKMPPFITKMHILDLLETTELGHCRLLMGSFSYLLDFARAVDYLCCDELKSQVEIKIKSMIDETNWREALNYTKTIIGLENIALAALKTIVKAMDKYVFYKSHPLDKEHEDPWISEYSTLPVHLIKIIMIRSKHKAKERNKIHILRNWVARNSFLSHQAAVLDMLRSIKLWELMDSLDEVTSLVSKWPLNQEQRKTFSSVVEAAWQKINSSTIRVEVTKGQKAQQLRIPLRN